MKLCYARSNEKITKVDRNPILQFQLNNSFTQTGRQAFGVKGGEKVVKSLLQEGNTRKQVGMMRLVVVCCGLWGDALKCTSAVRACRLDMYAHGAWPSGG